jgi:hypothetical protein
VVVFVLILVGAAIAVPVLGTFLSDRSHAPSSRSTPLLDPSLGGGTAVSELNAIYTNRSDLQEAFPNATTNLTNYTELINWAAGVATGSWADPSFSDLAPFGYWYVLMATYSGRADLQEAFPNATTNFTNFTELVDWAASVVDGSFVDGAYLSLASFGYWYALMATYNGRSDLQAAFPNAYTNSTEFEELVDWAGAVVTGETQDNAYASLAPYGYWYALMSTYNDRTDLQAAFPNATANFTEFTDLVDWASGVVTDQWSDSAASVLAPFAPSYVLMATYNGRPDLQATFPNAYQNFGSYTELVQWAGAVVTGAFSDNAEAALAPYGYFYTVMTVYDGRADLLAAFPDAFTNWTSQQALITWAGGVVTGNFSDSNQATLQTYAYWYALFGWVYDNRADLQTAYPLAPTDEGSSQGLTSWAEDVALGNFPDPAYTTLEPYASDY